MSLNAPFGARCFLTARRVVPPVARGNVTSDRQWPKKHPSGQQARGQITRLFVATARIATDRSKGRFRSGNRLHPRTLGVSLLHNASHLESNRKVVEWKDRQ